jgi:hypothetical protein
MGRVPEQFELQALQLSGHIRAAFENMRLFFNDLTGLL